MKITRRQLRKIITETLKDHQPDRATRKSNLYHTGEIQYTPQEGDVVEVRNGKGLGSVIKVFPNQFGYAGDVVIQLDRGPIIKRSQEELIPRG